MLKPSQVCSSKMGWPAQVSQVCMHLLLASAQIQASLLLRLHMQETLVVAYTPDSVFKSNFFCVLSSSSHFNTSFLISSSGLQYSPSIQLNLSHTMKLTRGGGKQPTKSYPNLRQLLQQFYSIVYEPSAIFLILCNLLPTLMLRRNN